MKAFLLAAGLGTRLKPITNHIPKCLVPILNKPLLAWWIDLFEKHGIDEVLINVHHMPEKVVSFIKGFPTIIKFHIFYEDVLLGSAGTIKKNKDFTKSEADFFIIYADNLTNYDLTSFHNFYREKQNSFSMALFETDTPELKGIVTINDDKLITSFEEKPTHPKSNLANAGIYISNNEIFELIPEKLLADIGYDLLPKLVNRMYGWESSNYLLDIGTIEHLEKANKEWPVELLKGNY